jgi:hypothetical protein
MSDSISISMRAVRGATSPEALLSESGDVLELESGGAIELESGGAFELESEMVSVPPRPERPRRSDAVLLTSPGDPRDLVELLVARLDALELRVQPLAAPYIGLERAKKVLVLIDDDGDVSPELDAPLQRLAASGLHSLQRIIPLVVGGQPRRMRRDLAQLRFVIISEAVTPEQAEMVSDAIRFDPEDPQKGKWGRSKSRNRRTLDATVQELPSSWFKVTLEVRSTDRKRPLTGEVVFHLHPTFPKARRVVSAKDGVCTLEFECYGAFTVGAETDGGETHLELDLSKLKGAPQLFRER